MKKVVSATLAGALAVGAVPMMAMADDSIELQATVAEDVNAGAIASYDEAAMADYAAGYVFTAGSAGIGEVTALVPATIETLSGAEMDVTKVRYYKLCKEGEGTQSICAIDGKKFWFSSYSTEAPRYAGEYAVVAYADTTPEGDSTPVYTAEKFTIVSAELDGAVAYEVNATDIADVEFIWRDQEIEFASVDDNADLWDLNLKIGEKALLPTDYEVKAIYDAKGNVVNEIEAAGTYKVAIAGETVDSFYYGKTANVYVTVDPMDLAEAEIAFTGIDANGFAERYADIEVYSVENADGFAIADLEDAVAETFDTDDEAATLGVHSVTVDLPAGTAFAGNVIGSQTVAYTVVSEICGVTARYDDSADDNGVAFENQTFVIGDENGVYFDDKYIVDETAILDAGAKALADGQYTVKVERQINAALDLWAPASVEELEAADIQALYRVSVVVDAAAVEYAFAGASEYIYFDVQNGVIEDATAAYTFDGVLVAHGDMDNFLPLEYTGENFMDRIDASVAAKLNGTVIKQLVEGVDYTLAIKKWDDEDQDWVDADSLTDWGVYNVVVVSEKYDVQGGELFVGIDPALALAIPADQVNCHDDFAMPIEQGCDATVLWNGDVINPIAGFLGSDFELIAVPASAYEWAIVDYKAEGANEFWFSSKKPGLTLPAVVQDPGLYKIVLADADPTDNYHAADFEFVLHVTADSVFKDVPSDAWFADEVWLADQLGYMNGYKVGDLFGPYDSIIRGDAALVLFRMAGADEDDTLFVDFEDGVYTPFEDVFQGAYYAMAIAWADDAEIMTGYGDGSEFGPNDKITREQVATALYRYNKYVGQEDNLDVLASALDAYVDGDEVSAWAVEAMEWAVENGIMGVNTDALNPQAEITRAEFAAMMVRYQPQGKLFVDDEGMY